MATKSDANPTAPSTTDLAKKNNSRRKSVPSTAFFDFVICGVPDVSVKILTSRIRLRDFHERPEP